jgi:hypothetical protein
MIDFSNIFTETIGDELGILDHTAFDTPKNSDHDIEP